MAGNAIKAGEAFLTLSVRDKDFRSSLNRSLGRLAGLGRSLRSIGSLGFGGLTGFQRLLFSIAGSAAIAWPIKLAADLEQTKAAFTALTGSAQSAGQILDELQIFAGIAGQSFEQLQHATRALLNYGVAADRVVPIIKSLAAISGGNADTMDRLAIAFGQVQAKGKLAAEEVRQMVNAGFSPLQEISRTTGKSFKQLIAEMEAGKISVEQVEAAFRSVTGPGGRFGKILEAIANTARGQFNILKAGVSIAVRALGEDLLPSITGVLKKLNELVPALQAFLKTNAKMATVMAIGAAGVALVLGTVFSLGVAMQIAAFAIGGLVTVVATLLNPLTLIAILVASSTVAIIRFTSVGTDMVRFLSGRFLALVGIARDTFGGIADALAGGDVQAAAIVMWAGLRLAWTQGTKDLQELWFAFKDIFLRATIDMTFGALSYWTTFVQSVKSLWQSLVTESQTIGETIGHNLSRSDDPELAAAQDEGHNLRLQGIAQEGAAKQQAIETEKRAQLALIDATAAAAKASREKNSAEEIKAAIANRKSAQRAFDLARKQAAANRGKEPDGQGILERLIAGVGSAEAGIKSRSVFGSRIAGQVFGPGAKTDPIPRLQLIQQRAMARSLERIERQKAFGLRAGGS